jgi:hypothetical protein
MIAHNDAGKDEKLRWPVTVSAGRGNVSNSLIRRNRVEN